MSILEMALTGREAAEWEQRRDASRKRASESPRGPAAVALGLQKTLIGVARPGYFTEGAMLKAQCKRLTNQCTVIGNTVFRFDKNGITRTINQANVLYDFNELLKQNGVIELNDDETPKGTASPAAVPPPAVTAPVVESPAPVTPPVLDEQLEEMEAAPPDLVVPEPAPAAPAADAPTKKEVRRKPAAEK
jgi:hypothetical protein